MSGSKGALVSLHIQCIQNTYLTNHQFQNNIRHQVSGRAGKHAVTRYLSSFLWEPVVTVIPTRAVRYYHAQPNSTKDQLIGTYV